MSISRQQPTIDYGHVHIVAYYMVVAYCSILQPFNWDSQSASLFGTFAVALPATLWLVADAKKRRRPVVHILQPFVLANWLVVIPLYLLFTRGLWGVALLAIHIALTILISNVFFHSTVLLFWGPGIYFV